MPAKHNEEFIINSIESNNEYKVISMLYENQKSKITIHHNTCNRDFITDFDHWSRGQRCPFCAKEKQLKTNNDFLNKINKLGINKYTFLSEYKNKRTKIKVRCNDCGNVYEILPCNIYNKHCKYCSALERSNRQKHTIEEINNILTEKRPRI